MKTNILKQCNVKRFFVIVPVTVLIMLSSIQCKNGEKCENAVCTKHYASIVLLLQDPDGQPVLLDSCKVFWVSKNRYVEKNFAAWNEARMYGSYVIADDAMRKELENKQEIMCFTAYLNGETVCERDVLVGADCCHVYYCGAEPLTEVIYNISGGIPANGFCEWVNG